MTIKPIRGEYISGKISKITGNKFAIENGTNPTNLKIIIIEKWFFLNILSNFLNLFSRLSFKKLYKKYLPIKYSARAPTDKLTATNIVPTHFPNIKPPIKTTGLPNPNKKTQNTVKKKNNKNK